MNSKNVNILSLSDIQYMVERIKHSEMSEKIYKRFFMVRKYNIIDEIAVDNDIYFIPCDIDNLNEIIWPIINEQNKIYSTDYSLFNDIDVYDELINGQIKINKYDIYTDNTLTDIAYIPCDEIRIYKPINRTNLDNIIHIYNRINDIHVHYFCQQFDKQKVLISNEIYMNNNHYNEYISLYVPNVDELFKERQFWYKEDLNNTLELVKYDGDNIVKIDLDNTLDAVPLNLLIEPYYKIEVSNNIFAKIYCDNIRNSEHNYLNIPINICMIYYNDISNNIYTVTNNNEYSGIVSFVNDNFFKLKSRIGFDDNGVISFINEFDYPNKDKYSLEEAYFFYNKISEDKIDDYYNFAGWENDEFFDLLSDEYGDEFNYVSFNAAGYYIEISSSADFDESYIIYKFQHETKKIQDFAFQLNGIFDSWHQYPNSLFARALFIDKYLSKVIYGNITVITKEQFKYCINDLKIYRLNCLSDKQIDNMNTENFNFINNINCIVTSENNDNINFNAVNKQYQIIYKPIFYKVSDVQSISIRRNVVQNIGINLSNFLTKVNSFILDIDGNRFSEYARNDGFVIFTINSNILQNASGYYNILNNSDEYIASGIYSLY